MEKATKLKIVFRFSFACFRQNPIFSIMQGILMRQDTESSMRLKEKYPDCCIQPALKIYRKMLQCFEQRNDQKSGQTDHPKSILYRDSFFQWFTEEEQALLQQLWAENKRIPQEVLTIETWRRWM